MADAIDNSENTTDNDTGTTAQPSPTLGQRLQGLKRGTGNLVDGDDGSIIWFIKWCGAQLKLAAEAISQQVLSAQNSAQRRLDESRQEREGYDD